MRTSTKRKRQLYSSGAKLESITLYYQKIPAAKFMALSTELRYCLLVMGHIHDELNWIQRMAFLTTRQPKFRREVQRQGQMMQSLALARLFLAKLLEFWNLLEPAGSPLRAFIADNFHPDHADEGVRRLDELSEHFKAEGWLGTVRNKHFMHYPRLESVRETLEDTQIQWGLEIYHGTRTSNTLYPTSDVLANYAWFRRVNPNSPMDGLGEALDSLTALSRLTLSTLEESIGHFVDRNLMPLNENERIKLNVPSSRGKTLDYFLALQ